jgi:maltooligosyltrehalose synthase
MREKMENATAKPDKMKDAFKAILMKKKAQKTNAVPILNNDYKNFIRKESFNTELTNLRNALRLNHNKSSNSLPKNENNQLSDYTAPSDANKAK